MKFTKVALAVAMFLSGCAIHKGAEFQKTADLKVVTAASSFPEPSQSTNLHVVEVLPGDYYFGRASTPAKKDGELPPFFNEKKPIKVGLVQDGRLNLTRLAEEITRKFSIPVDIDANVYVRSAKLPTANTGAQVGGNSSVRADEVANDAYQQEENIELNEYDELPKILDRIVARLGISWEYDRATSRLRFYRYKSRYYELRVPESTVKDSATFASAGSNTSGNGATAADMSTQFTRDSTLINFYDEIAKDLARLNSAGGGSCTVNKGTGTALCVDTPVVLDRIGQYIEETNAVMNRSVLLNIEIVSVSGRKANEFGVDAQGVFTAANGKIRTFVQSGTSLVSGAAGSLTGAILGNGTVATPGAPGKIGDGIANGAGSIAAIQALAQWEKVTLVDSLRAITLNKIPTNVVSNRNTEYLKKLGRVTSNQNGTSELSTEQATASDGISIVMRPTIYRNSEIALSYSVNISKLLPFDVSDVSGVSIKSKNDKNSGGVWTARFVPGIPVALAELTRVSAYDNTNVGFGGSTVNGQADEKLLVIVTATLVK